ncbi:hypothetical protein INR49_006948 [Caranx melampygus]|nr:hypothetical protein INR49_006948 [Caranx melampygus]
MRRRKLDSSSVVPSEILLLLTPPHTASAKHPAIHISSDLLIGRLRPQVSNASAVLITAHFSRSLHLTEPVADLLFRLSSVNLWSAAPWGPFDDRWEPGGHTRLLCQRDAWYSRGFPETSRRSEIVFNREEEEEEEEERGWLP